MGNRNRMLQNTAKKAVLFLSTSIAMQIACANPSGGVVTSGAADITQTSSTTTITQRSNNAIINWDSFNIAGNETTHFEQPSNGIALNRISPMMGASEIYGHLSATGKIILVNQAGIYFGSGAQVDVGGMIASTKDVTTTNFLAGKYIFDQTPEAYYNGSIINQGKIAAADNGLIALLGAGVRNDGVIQAHMGNVILASGDKFTIDMYGDQLVNFAVDKAARTAGVDQNGTVLKNGIANTGAILADGGTIIMSARTARGVLDNAINMSGLAQARSVSRKNGVIVLDSGDGTVKVSGQIDVSGKATNQTGGIVKILGNKIRIKKHAVIDGSGDAGGGEILIGGNYQGKGPEQNAWSTKVAAGVTLNADAMTNGNGGRIIVWAHNDTRFAGSASVRGGMLGGDGGLIETSAHYLSVDNAASINLAAPIGKGGNWLLDPLDLEITTVDNNVTSNSPFSPTSSPSTIAAETIMNALITGDVTVTTQGTVGSENGDIYVNAPITLPTNALGSLTLDAAGDILLNANIQMSNGTTPNKDLTLKAVGMIKDLSSVTLSGYNVSLTAANIQFSQGSTLMALGGYFALGATPSGTLSLTATGTGPNALDLQSVTLDSLSGGSIGLVKLTATNPAGGISLSGSSVDSVSICKF